MSKQQNSLILSSATTTTQVEPDGSATTGKGESLSTVSGVTGINACGKQAEKG